MRWDSGGMVDMNNIVWLINKGAMSSGTRRLVLLLINYFVRPNKYINFKF
jgi:hypothetical protein